ncbi:hypothetical protein FACS189459_0230 [Bacilli bacterium]|nr:hypothetical protein FACS189459_0230 [Bacilli bacterium]
MYEFHKSAAALAYVTFIESAPHLDKLSLNNVPPSSSPRVFGKVITPALLVVVPSHAP